MLREEPSSPGLPTPSPLFLPESGRLSFFFFTVLRGTWQKAEGGAGGQLQETLPHSHHLGSLWWEDEHFLRSMLCLAAHEQRVPGFIPWLNAVLEEDEVMLLSQLGGVSRRAHTAEEEVFS